MPSERLIEAHTRWLGALVQEPGIDRGPFVDFDVELARRLVLPTARIACTLAGHVGDSGTSSLLGRAIAAADAGVPFNIKRLVRRSVPTPTIGLPGAGQRVMWGLDGRSLLPPFVPFGRNQDGVFLAMMRKFVPCALALYLPFCVLHLPKKTMKTCGGRGTTRATASPYRT